MHTHALLTDFGIARLLGDQSNMTADGALVGTPNYMSPEAAQGEPCDARSDAHSGFLVDALDNDLSEARRHAEHIINVIEGKNGQHFGDLDRDGMAQNPGDGVGVRVYLLAAREQMVLAAAAMPPTLESRFYAERYLAANDHSLLLLEEAYEKALQVFAVDSTEEARPLAAELRIRVHAALDGQDSDGNGVIDPFADEGGIGALYEMGLLFSQFPLFEK